MHDTVFQPFAATIQQSPLAKHAGRCWPKTRRDGDAAQYRPCSSPCQQYCDIVQQLDAFDRRYNAIIAAHRLAYIEYSQCLQRALPPVIAGHSCLLYAMEMQRHMVRVYDKNTSARVQHTPHCLCCMSAPVECVVRPCMHAQLCLRCAVKLQNGKQINCPSCQTLGTVEKIFL